MKKFIFFITFAITPFLAFSEEEKGGIEEVIVTAERQASSIQDTACLLYTSPSPRDVEESRMPSSA